MRLAQAEGPRAGLCSRIPFFLLLPQPVRVWEPGLGSAHHPASCFVQPPSPPYPRTPGRLPSPASLSRCLFSSKESACPAQGPKLPHCHRRQCGPHISPSTSILNLVLSHGDREEGAPQCHLLGLINAPAAHGGGDEEVEPPCLCRARQGLPQWGLGPSRTTSVEKQKQKHSPGCSLRHWQGLVRPHSPPLLPFLPILTVVTNPEIGRAHV